MQNGLKLAWLLCLVSVSTALAQCVTPDFTSPSNACKGQRISLVADNDYNSYEWDLCSGELSGTPAATVLNDNFGGYGFKMELVEDDGDFYGFFLSRGSNKFYRLDFGTSIKDPPLLVDLGGLGKSSNTWRMIEIIKEGSDYIGFIIDENAIYRLNFGNSPANTPQPLETFYTGSPMNLSIDAVAVQEGSDKYLFVANSGNDKVVRFKFNSSYAEPSSSTTIDTFSISGALSNTGISMIKDCDKWYAFTSSIIVAGVFKVALDDLSDTTPTVTFYNVPSAGGLAAVKDNNTYMVFAQSLNSTSSIFRMTFGADLSGNPASTTELKDFGYAPGGPSVFGFAMYKVKSDWLAVSAENAGANMYRITFPQSCLSAASWSTERNPVVTTSNAGNFNITLDVTDPSGLHSSKSHSLTVSSSTSPDIEFTSANVCAAHNVDFQAQNTSGDVTSYNWDFDDMTTSGSTTPVHQFAAGTYDVSLTASALSTGCSNTATHSLKIYAPPVADFQVPSGLICTNNDFTFVNQVADVYDGLMTYQWLVDGVQASTARDLVIAFSSVNDKVIDLITTIPGCFDDKQKTMAGILPGASVSYSIDGQCQDANINFTNSSTGTVTLYTWDFDNGSTSHSVNSTTTYNTPGPYMVSLQALAPNGCITTVSKALSIYSTPLPAFSLDLPPFSCSGTPSQFHDTTGLLTDSNIQAWTWTFGDGGGGTGKNPAHTYTQAGPYTVALSVVTDKGCTRETQQPVTITQSPVASFNIDPTCMNQSTRLTDTSTGNVVGWQWKLGTAVYTNQNPTHVFAAAGNFSMQLTVTGQNNCTNTLSKPVVVPVVPVVDFSVSNPCSGQPVAFADLTANASDPVTQRTWTFHTVGTGTGQQTEFSFANSGTYPVQLQVQAQSGCVYATSKQVVIRQSPVASFTMSDQSGPPPFHVLFTNTSTGATSYRWNFDDGNPLSTEVSPQHTYDALGEYVVALTATSADGCMKIESKPVTVIVPFNELALEEFSLVKPSGGSSYLGYVRVRNHGNYRIDSFGVSYDIGGNVRLREIVVGSLSAGATGTFILSNQFFDPGSAAFVCAELDNDRDLSDNRGCTTVTNSTVIFNPNPNPANSFLNIESVSATPGVVRVRLYNMAGGLAYNRSFDVGTGLSRLSLDIQDLSPGLYVVVVSGANATSSQKILIAR